MLTTATVADTGNVLIDALTWGAKWVGSSGPFHIKVGFKLIDGLIPTLAETEAVKSVLAEFERVINVDFEYIGVDTTGSADLTFQIASDAWDTSFGWSIPAGETRYAYYGDVNVLRNNYMDSTPNFAPGSFDYITFLHEFAHVMGLAHPHDAGGGSVIFPGVTSETTIGQYGLNQGVYTTMTYNDGLQVVKVETALSFWLQDEATGEILTGQNRNSNDVTPEHGAFGLQGGLMALDILALQNLYGANFHSAAGDTQYVLPSQNVVGTSYTSIWDTSGIDSILAQGQADATIDLRAATGLVAEGGGGFISAVANVIGGFTIAAGVVIENAISDAGDDFLFGNDEANMLVGRHGNDRLMGFKGRDELWGGQGADQFVFLSELDSGPTVLSGDVIKDFNISDDLIDLIGIDANSSLAGNQSFRFLGNASSFLAAGDLRIGTSGGNTVLYLNTDADMSSESVIVLNGVQFLTASDFLL